jgi:putative copper export protein/mono/diheme cytochrome c family protein
LTRVWRFKERDVFEPLMLARTAHFAAAAMLSGVTFFVLFVAEPVWARAFGGPEGAVTGLRRQFVRLAWIMLALSVASGLVWLVVLASRLTGQSLEEAVSGGGVWKVLTETRFGNDWLLRAVLAVLIAISIKRLEPLRGWPSRWEGAVAVLLSGAFMASLAWAGHGGASAGAAGAIQVVADALHLIAAGAWIGGLLPFTLVMVCALRTRSEVWNLVAADVTRRFSAFAVVVVGVLLLTGLSNTWFLVGSLPRLLGTTYGQLLLLKIALVIAMVAVAAVNRLVLMPRLRDAAGAAGVLSRLRRNGLIEIALGLVILAVVGTLGTTPPAAHTQVQWPFPVRLSAAALNDPASRTSAVLLLAAMVTGTVLILFGARVRRLRWPMLAGGGVLWLLAVPWLGMFTSEAYPTSFYASPTGFSAQSIAAGEVLFAQNCASCHGPDGHGDGPAAKDLQPPPADLTAGHIYVHSDGDLFWWITHGIGAAMPAFGTRVDPTGRWNLIDFIHANADATRFGSAADAGMTNGFRAPDFGVDCPDGSSPSISELRGRVLHLVFAGAHATARVRSLEPTAIVIRLDPAVSEVGSLCNTDDPDVAKAYALYAGSSVEELDGTEFIIDQSGSLRVTWHPGLVPEWTDPKVFAELVETIRKTPSASRPALGHVHMH